MSSLEKLVEGTSWNICGTSAFWNPLKSSNALVGGKHTFHQMHIGFPSLLLLGPGCWCWVGRCWWRVLDSGFPSLPSSLMENAWKIITEESLFRILTFSSVLRPSHEAQFLLKRSKLLRLRVIPGSPDGPLKFSEEEAPCGQPGSEQFH